MSSRLHGPYKLGDVVAVEEWVDVGAQPIAGGRGLVPALVGQTPAGVVPGEELPRVVAVVALLRLAERDVALGLAVTDQNQIERHGHAGYVPRRTMIARTVSGLAALRASRNFLTSGEFFSGSTGL